MVSLRCACMKGWVNNRESGYLRRQRTYYDVKVMSLRVESLHIWSCSLVTIYCLVLLRHALCQMIESIMLTGWKNFCCLHNKSSLFTIKLHIQYLFACYRTFKWMCSFARNGKTRASPMIARSQRLSHTSSSATSGYLISTSQTKKTHKYTRSLFVIKSSRSFPMGTFG